MLLRGDLEHGWREYEWRWKLKELRAPNFRQPQWCGEPLAGKTIYLYAEQGLGDTIQFVRYAPMVKSLGANVIVACREPILKLLASCPGIDHLVSSDVEMPAFDYHAPLMSLPRSFQLFQLLCRTCLLTRNS